MIRKCLNEVCEMCADRFFEIFTVIFIVFALMAVMYYTHKKQYTEIDAVYYNFTISELSICGDLIEEMMIDDKIIVKEYDEFVEECKMLETEVNKEKLKKSLENRK